MNFWKNVGGRVTLELTSADLEGTLQCLNQLGIQLWQLEKTGDLSVQLQCRCQDRKQVEKICRKRGDRISVLSETGLFYIGKKILNRPILTCGCCILFTLTILIPTRILFFEVEGNTSIPDRLILETAADCGIRFGVSRRQVRSEKMKNALLEAMPELKWAGINTAGCRATISVRERAMEEQPTIKSGELGSIAAIRDAYVTEVTVTRGSALCVPGQVVTEGQILISGYTDLGLCIQVTRAQGEVFGETVHDFKTVIPLEADRRAECGDPILSYSLIFGKKRINFGKGSGISTTTCGRIYKEYGLTLPGGYVLPLRFAVEMLTPCTAEKSECRIEEQAVLKFIRDQVLARTVAGAILTEDWGSSRIGEWLVYEGKFSVREMIGKAVTEEIGEVHGKTD